jgi:hypothetical protein
VARAQKLATVELRSRSRAVKLQNPAHGTGGMDGSGHRPAITRHFTLPPYQALEATGHACLRTRTEKHRHTQAKIACSYSAAVGSGLVTHLDHAAAYAVPGDSEARWPECLWMHAHLQYRQVMTTTFFQTVGCYAMAELERAAHLRQSATTDSAPRAV